MLKKILVQIHNCNSLTKLYVADQNCSSYDQIPVYKKGTKTLDPLSARNSNVIEFRITAMNLNMRLKVIKNMFIVGPLPSYVKHDAEQHSL